VRPPKRINEKAKREGKEYEFTEKAIQLRWTDIEIRKYRLNDAAQGYIPESTLS
jgi:hypothetical protein